MSFVILALVAFIASVLTFFSGFGLGTVLLPAFALYFPAEVAVALTAIVHLSNNLFKLVLVGKDADLSTLFRFGGPALIGAAVGALLLSKLGQYHDGYSYKVFATELKTTPVAITIGSLMIFFAIFDLLPCLNKLSVKQQYMPFGGVLSGFFGGLSGHQGAFRTVFLVRSGLTKESFIGTGVCIAVFVDITRLVIYGTSFQLDAGAINKAALLTAIVSAFLGTYVGQSYLRKVTLGFIHKVVGLLLITLGLAIASGTI